VVAAGELSPADRLVLDGYAKRTADRVWTLSQESVLAALAAGRSAGDLRDFLHGRAAQSHPILALFLLK